MLRKWYILMLYINWFADRLLKHSQFPMLISFYSYNDWALSSDWVLEELV